MKFLNEFERRQACMIKNHLDPNLKNPSMEPFSFSPFSPLSLRSLGRMGSFSLHLRSLVSLRWSKMALSVMLSTFQMLLRLVSYLSSMPFRRLSMVATRYSMVSTFSSTKAEMLLSSEASLTCSWMRWRSSLMSRWTSVKDISSLTSWMDWPDCFIMLLCISFRMRLLSSINSLNSCYSWQWISSTITSRISSTSLPRTSGPYCGRSSSLRSRRRKSLLAMSSLAMADVSAACMLRMRRKNYAVMEQGKGGMVRLYTEISQRHFWKQRLRGWQLLIPLVAARRGCWMSLDC